MWGDGIWLGVASRASGTGKPALSISALEFLSGILQWDGDESWFRKLLYGFYMGFIEGSLEVKLPTIWTVEKQR